MSNSTKQECTNNSKPRRQHSSSQQLQVDFLRRAMEWALNDLMFAKMEKHGNVRWAGKSLVTLAILMCWSESKQLTDAFEKAASLSQRLLGVLAVTTYQSLMRALVTYGPQLLPRTWSRLHLLMQQTSPQHFRIGVWVPLAVDGSRFTTPRTKSNETAFAAKNFGKGKQAKSRRRWQNKKKRIKKLCTPVKPQIWLTLIWHMGMKLPWCWRSGPSTSSERHHLVDMLESAVVPEKTLFCCDAGFVGYELWSSIIRSGHSFLIRVGANVRLLKDLGHARTRDGIVYLWPDAAARKHQPPLILRLIEIKNCKGHMFLVTNVINNRELSDASIKKLYPLRWGVELQFRATKQTFGRTKLRCRNAAHALAELDWSLVALTLVQLFAIRQQVKIDEPPENMSVALALKAVRHAIVNWNQPASLGGNLNQQLQNSVKDLYQRASNKQARYHPDYKDKPSTTKPIIRAATNKQKKKYANLNLIS